MKFFSCADVFCANKKNHREQNKCAHRRLKRSRLDDLSLLSRADIFSTIPKKKKKLIQLKAENSWNRPFLESEIGHESVFPALFSERPIRRAVSTAATCPHVSPAPLSALLLLYRGSSGGINSNWCTGRSFSSFSKHRVTARGFVQHCVHRTNYRV